MNYIKRIQKRINEYRESKHLSADPLVAELQKALELNRVLENLDALVFNYNVDAIGKFKKFKDYPLPPLRYNNRLNAHLSPNNLY